MKATLTELHRQTKRVVRPATQGQRVVITEHGQPVASIHPACERRVVTADELLKMEISDQSILDAIAEARL